MLSTASKSDLLKFRNGNVIDSGESLKRILERGEAADDVVREVLGALQAGKYVAPMLLGQLIGESKSHDLLAASRATIFKDTWALLEIHKREFPDSEIQQALCDRLYLVANSDDNPLRRCIVESLRDHGAADAIPTLEGMLFEQIASLKVKKCFARAIEGNDFQSIQHLLHTIETNSGGEFVSLLVNTIKSIEERSQVKPEYEPAHREMEADFEDKDDPLMRQIFAYQTR